MKCHASTVSIFYIFASASFLIMSDSICDNLLQLVTALQKRSFWHTLCIYSKCQTSSCFGETAGNEILSYSSQDYSETKLIFENSATLHIIFKTTNFKLAISHQHKLSQYWLSV